MRFSHNFLFLFFLSFLFSCSSGRQHFSFSSISGHTNLQAAGAITKTETSKLTIVSVTEENSPVLAYSGNPAVYIKKELSGNTLLSPKSDAPEVKIISEPGSATKVKTGKTLKNKFFGSNSGPGVDKVKLYGRLALASGILAFAPFVLSMSLLYAIPFAISGLIFGRLALNNRKGNFRQKGVAMAKAGFMMSIVISVILFALGLSVLVGS